MIMSLLNREDKKLFRAPEQRVDFLEGVLGWVEAVALHEKFSHLKYIVFCIY